MIPRIFVVVVPYHGDVRLTQFDNPEDASKAFTQECQRLGDEPTAEHYKQGKLVSSFDGTMILLNFDTEELWTTD